MSQEFYFFLEKVALVQLGVKRVVSKYLEYLAQVVEVCTLILAVDEDVIEVNNDKLVEQGLEVVVHEHHECCQCVGETECQN